MRPVLVRFLPKALCGLALLAALPAGAETGDALATYVKRLENRITSCEAMRLESERKLVDLEGHLANPAEASDAQIEALRDEIEWARLQLDAMDDCAADLVSFSDEVGQRLQDEPEAVAPADEEEAAGEGESLASLQVRHDIIDGRIERLRKALRAIRDRLAPTISRAGLTE